MPVEGNTMKKAIKALFILVLYSCNERSDNSNCAYHVQDFIRSHDTSQYNLKVYPGEGMTEIKDTNTSVTERGIYKFDEKNILRFYGFLINENNGYHFGVDYDPSGKEIKRVGSEVIQWYFRKISTDTIRVTFLLFGLHNHYDQIVVRYPNGANEQVELMRSDRFSNLLGNSLDFAKLQLNAGRSIYIQGDRINECTQSRTAFKDSVQIPSAMN